MMTMLVVMMTIMAELEITKVIRAMKIGIAKRDDEMDLITRIGLMVISNIDVMRTIMS